MRWCVAKQSTAEDGRQSSREREGKAAQSRPELTPCHACIGSMRATISHLDTGNMAATRLSSMLALLGFSGFQGAPFCRQAHCSEWAL